MCKDQEWSTLLGLHPWTKEIRLTRKLQFHVQRSSNVMHVVKKLEKFEKEIDLLHVNQLHQTFIDPFFHPRGMKMEE